MRETFNAQHGAALFDMQCVDDFIVGEDGVDGNIRVPERHPTIVFEDEEDVARDEVSACQPFAQCFRHPGDFERYRFAIEQAHAVDFGDFRSLRQVQSAGYLRGGRNEAYVLEFVDDLVAH